MVSQAKQVIGSADYVMATIIEHVLKNILKLTDGATGIPPLYEAGGYTISVVDIKANANVLASIECTLALGSDRKNKSPYLKETVNVFLPVAQVNEEMMKFVIEDLQLDETVYGLTDFTFKWAGLVQRASANWDKDKSVVTAVFPFMKKAPAAQQNGTAATGSTVVAANS